MEKQKPLTIDEKPVAPTHYSIYDTLKSSNVLKPIFIDVKNESYWYGMRIRMGIRKHDAFIIEQSSLSSRWEAYIYKMKPREEDLEIVPLKQYIGTFNTRWIAYKNCDNACKERDADPIDRAEPASLTNLDHSKIPCTHLKIVVVSECFDRMNELQRLEIIYQELLRKLGASSLTIDPGPIKPDRARRGSPVYSQRDVQLSLLSSRVYGLRFCSTFGSNVCKLSIFRFLSLDSKIKLFIEAKTPSEWRQGLYPAPISERLGPAHVGLRSRNISSSVKPSAQRKRVKLLAGIGSTAQKASKSSSKSQNHELPVSSKINMIGVSTKHLPPPTAPSRGGDKIGGIYGHFYDDLSTDMRKLVESEHQRNKRLIQTDGYVKQFGDMERIQSAYGIRSLRSRARRSLSPGSSKARGVYGSTGDTDRNETPSDKGTQSEQEMLEELYIRAHQLERATIRMQRIWRSSVWPRAIRWSWRKEFAALTIQRIVRGYFGRCYASLLSQLRPIAAIKIQRTYRKHRRREAYRKWLATVYRAAKIIFPYMKRFIRKCAEQRLRKYNHSAVLMQSCVRVYLANIRFYKLQGERIFVPAFRLAAGKIQRVYRGYRARCRVQILWEILLFNRITVPAALLIQRVFRGSRSRIIASRKRHERATATYLQRWARQRLHYRSERRRLLALRQREAATTIQKLYRGRLDREIYARALQKNWYENVYLVAVCRVQSVIRMVRAKKEVSDRRRRFKSAIVIQKFYKSCKIRRAFREVIRRRILQKKVNLAISMQKMVRGWLARLKIPGIRYQVAGKRLLAAKVILRAWVNYRDSKRFQKLLEESRLRRLAKRILTLQEARFSLEKDISEISIDIDAMKKTMEKNKIRIKELLDFEVEANMRLPKLHQEVEEIDMGDVDRGWAEAYGFEYEQLTYQTLMVKQELRIRRAQHRKNQKELMELYFELEESELERLELLQKEINTHEFLRRSEIGRLERKLKDIREREVRIERCRWKIASIRRSVIMKSRYDYDNLVKQAKAGRDTKFAQAVGYERRQQQIDREEFTLKDLLKKAEVDIAVRESKYEEYAKPLQDTYDAVVGNTLSLLRGFTLDERASLHNNRVRAQERKLRLARKGVTAALKQENVQKRAFDYLLDKEH